MTKTRFNHNWTDYARAIGYTDERDMLTDMYVVKELSLSQIAERLQCGTYTVNRHLNLLEITKRLRGGCNSSPIQTLKLFYTDQRIIHRTSLNTLAREIQVSSSLLYKYKSIITRGEQPWNSASSVPSPDLNVTQP